MFGFGKPKSKRPAPYTQGKVGNVGDPGHIPLCLGRISEQLDYIAQLLEQQQEAQRLRDEAGK